jgi:hypothetical protein
MRRFLKNLFGSKTHTVPKSPAASAPTRLGVHALETREMPAVVSGGALVITGTTGSDVVNVSAVTLNGVAQVRVVQNGVTQNFARSLITTNQVQFTGNAGSDIFTNSHAGLRAIADGGAGNDTLTGNALADTLTGGIGIDTLSGGGGNDRLLGGSNGDILSGGAGNDFLDGGTGLDVLSGGAGRDGLLGGPGDEGDAITGGTGQDRFLDWTNNFFGLGETRTDVAGEDAVIFFRDDAQQTISLGSNIGDVTYTAGTWSATQIESVDKGLAKLQTETSNTRLLKTDGGGSLTFHKAGAPDKSAASTVGGWNSGGGSITVTNFGAAASASTGLTADQNIQRVAIHEIGHNWDTESPFTAVWMSLSGWEQHIPGVHDLFPPAGKVKSDDGGWWRNSNAQFARDYGKMNPLEDFSTCWEAFFNLNGTRVAAKMTHLQMFFDHIQGLG